MAEVLEHIEADSIIPPLLVLQTLSKNPNLKVALVKGYIGRQLQFESTEIQQSRDANQKLQHETSQARNACKRPLASCFCSPGQQLTLQLACDVLMCPSFVCLTHATCQSSVSTVCASTALW